MRKIYIKSLKKYTNIRKKRLKSIALKVLELENAPKNLEIAVTIVDDSYIQKLNKKYRKVDSPTDVLAFNVEYNLGDIYISLNRAKNQIPLNETIETEIARLLIHAILHLLGYRHSKKMWAKQEYYLNLQH